MSGVPAWSPGVQRAHGAPAEVLAGLRASGWHAVLVRPGRSAATFHAGLARSLALPGWYGANLDALWDSLRGLDGPTALVLADWESYAAAEPERWQRFLELFAEAAADDPPFAAVLLS